MNIQTAPGRVGTLGENTLLLFETDCVNIYSYDSSLHGSNGLMSLWRKKFLMVHLPNTKRTMGEAVVWIWPTDVANQFQTFCTQVKNPTKFSPTRIWTRDQCTTSENSNHCVTLSPTHMNWYNQRVEGPFCDFKILFLCHSSVDIRNISLFVKIF